MEHFDKHNKNIDMKGFLLNNNEKQRKCKTNISKLYEFVFGEPKAKEMWLS